MTDKITVPRATWDAMRQALKDIAEESYDKGAVECANHALTSSNAVSAVPLNAVEKVNARAEFEEWWEKHGQFCRAGGGEYEKTFAWNAWLYQLVRISEDAEPSLTAANAVSAEPFGFGKILGTYGKVVEWPELPEPQAQGEAQEFQNGYDTGYEAGVLHASQATEPAGYKLVPVEPTREMREAGLNRLDTLNADPTRLLADRAYFIYRAMLAAAPEAKQ